MFAPHCILAYIIRIGFNFRRRWSITASRMCQYARGRRSRIETAPQWPRLARMRPLCDGCRIMRQHDARAAKRNSGSDGGGIIVGECHLTVNLKCPNIVPNVTLDLIVICSSCGQIFCADCSEYWAALPDERLYTPVRLCGPCYHSVTGKPQVSNSLHQHDLELHTSTTGRIM